MDSKEWTAASLNRIEPSQDLGAIKPAKVGD
jgi:hypothetical protein